MRGRTGLIALTAHDTVQQIQVKTAVLYFCSYTANSGHEINVVG